LQCVGAHIPMLLTIAHHNGQLIRISLYRVLLSIHWSEPEHCSLGPIAAHIQGHRYRVTEREPLRNELSQNAGPDHTRRRATANQLRSSLLPELFDPRVPVSPPQKERTAGQGRAAVSVIVIARFSVTDVRKAAEWARAHAEVPEDITAYGKSLGQRGHKMFTDGTDLVVIDEWPDADTFNTFFAGATRMGEFLSGAGIVGEPEVTVLDPLDVPGTF